MGQQYFIFMQDGDYHGRTYFRIMGSAAFDADHRGFHRAELRGGAAVIAELVGIFPGQQLSSPGCGRKTALIKKFDGVPEFHLTEIFRNFQIIIDHHAETLPVVKCPHAHEFKAGQSAHFKSGKKFNRLSRAQINASFFEKQNNCVFRTGGSAFRCCC